MEKRTSTFARMAQSNFVRHACQQQLLFLAPGRFSECRDHLNLISASKIGIFKFSRNHSTNPKLFKQNALPDELVLQYEVGYPAPVPDRRPVDGLPDDIPEDPEQLSAEHALLIKRDVSRMPRHYRDRMTHAERPPEIHFEAFKTRRFQRGLYARFGERRSGVNPALAWPTVEEIRERLKREKSMGKPTLHESWEQLRTQRETEQKAAADREKKIVANMKQMKQHIKEFRQKQKLLEDAAAAEQRKRQLLLDEARDTLGFDVDPRDPRFLQLMEERELELKKKRRLQKRQEKEDSIINRLKDMVEEDKAVQPEAEDEK